MSPTYEVEVRHLRAGQWLRRGWPGITPAGPAPFVGTNIAPGASIQAALDAGTTGQTFVLTGTPATPYRLTAALSPKTGQKIVSNTGAVLKGSKVLTGWTKDGTNARWYKDGALPAAYTDVGVCNITSGAEANPCQKREQIFLDGGLGQRHLTRTMVLASVGSDMFYEDYAANRIYIGTDPTNSTVEMSSTNYAVDASVTDVRLSGLTITHFASPSQQGAVYAKGANWEVDHCAFLWNHGSGLYLANSDSTKVHDNIFTRNGQAGMSHYSSNNTLVENNEFTFNNTDGYWPLDWESAGLKVTFSQGAMVRGNKMLSNNGLGLWFDIDNVGCTADSNLIEDNVSCGIRYEISFDAVISNNTIRRNGYGHTDATIRNGTDGSGFATAGINVNCSSGGYLPSMGTIDIFGNLVEDNQNGIHVQKRNRGNSGTYPTRPWTTTNVKVHDNTIIMRGRANDQFGWGSSGIGELGYTDDAVYHSSGNEFYNNKFFVDSLSATRFRYWNTAYNQMLSYATATAAGFNPGGSVAVAPRSGFRVAASVDDGNWSDSGSVSFSNTATVNRLGHFSATDFDRNSYVRIALTIPRGATVDTAVLELLPSGINGTIPALKIIGEAVDNASAISSRAGIATRPRTTAAVPWTPATWSVGTWVTSPDLKAVIQEIVNRPGWVAGNYVQLFIEVGVPGFTTQQQINFSAYDGTDTAQAAGLVATWH